MAKKTAKRTVKEKPKGKPTAKHKAPAAKRKSHKLKCCKNCADYKYCKDKNGCCEYCDYLINSKCLHGQKDRPIIGISAGKIQLSDYRGDDYGIDDYSAYDLGDN